MRQWSVSVATVSPATCTPRPPLWFLCSRVAHIVPCLHACVCVCVRACVSLCKCTFMCVCVCATRICGGRRYVAPLPPGAAQCHLGGVGQRHLPRCPSLPPSRARVSPCAHAFGVRGVCMHACAFCGALNVCEANLLSHAWGCARVPFCFGCCFAARLRL